MIEIRHRESQAVILRRAAETLAEALLAGEKLLYGDLLDQDLSGADLCQCDLAGADLSGASLEGADVSVVLLLRADRRRVRINGARMLGVYFTDAEFVRGSFQVSRFPDARLWDAVLDRADLSYTRPLDGDFTGADLDRVALQKGAASLRAAERDQQWPMHGQADLET